MRIVGGSARGLKLADVGEGDTAAHLRPTSDRVRESIFNLLINGTHGNPIPSARVLDLFAGTGALGLEALSRGAAHATLVDDGPAALTLMRRNIALMRGPDAQILRQNATRLPPNPGPAYGLIFLDPPYGKDLGGAALTSALTGGWIAPGAMIVWEENTPPPAPDPLTRIDQRKYGSTVITLLRMPG
ncbi:16S rRNA (guanine(966)-N(2))-methyltransferase RsmD [Phaeovulum sp.]|uniref:16S rRNA (guanine(966)-N(2))-methyltransferase RsmD n=1 Tax=Phaeovulum sp. TaxID=2934796 RepID=UPI0039E2A0E2